MVHGSVHPQKGSSRFSFVGETIAELKKVVWLTRREAVYLTTLVLIISIVAGLVLGAFDFGFSQLTELFLGG
jgi:preprotein translocase subunit SecE